MTEQYVKHVLLIDGQELWRHDSTEALRASGYSVTTLDDYDLEKFDASIQMQEPSLVIVGCNKVGEDEQAMIRHILTRQLRLAVLSPSIPWNDMRTLFLQGVDDVADKPYHGENLVGIVSNMLSPNVIEMEATASLWGHGL